MATLNGKGTEHDCGVCEKPFIRKRSDQVFCSSVCRSKKNHASSGQRYSLKKEYDLTLEDFNSMSESQGHVCKICKKTCDTYKNLSVDHSHATGKVRGLLCNKCNRGLGLLREDVAILQRAIDYLKENA